MHDWIYSILLSLVGPLVMKYLYTRHDSDINKSMLSKRDLFKINHI